MVDTKIYTAADRTALRFYYEAVLNNYQTEQFGQARYDNVLFVEVMTPGSKESAPILEIERVFCEEAGIAKPRRSTAYEKYAEQVEAFKRQSGEGAIDGTPVSNWPAIGPAMVKTLHGVNIYTVEQLADVADGNLPAIGMGAHQLREKARQYVASVSFSGNDEQVKRLTEENRLLRERLQLLEGSAGNASTLDFVPALASGPAVEQPAVVIPQLQVVPAVETAAEEAKLVI